MLYSTARRSCSRNCCRTPVYCRSLASASASRSRSLAIVTSIFCTTMLSPPDAASGPSKRRADTAQQGVNLEWLGQDSGDAGPVGRRQTIGVGRNNDDRDALLRALVETLQDLDTVQARQRQIQRDRGRMHHPCRVQASLAVGHQQRVIPFDPEQGRQQRAYSRVILDNEKRRHGSDI